MLQIPQDNQFKPDTILYNILCQNFVAGWRGGQDAGQHLRR